jgi:intracellular sulfur oxidation DsrE/DsrF family protein
MAAGVAELRSFGVRVLACRNTIARWSRELAAISGETPEGVQTKLLKGLSPGVEPVPAMIAAAVLAQSRNAAYVTIG